MKNPHSFRMPRYVGAISSISGIMSYFPETDLDLLFNGPFRAAINATTFSETGGSNFPTALGAVYVPRTNVYEFRSNPNPVILRRVMGMMWSEEMTKFEIAGGDRESEWAPQFALYEWNVSLVSGKNWRVFTKVREDQ